MSASGDAIKEDIKEIKKDHAHKLEDYKHIGLNNMRATSRTVITGTIDVSAAQSIIPPTLQEKLSQLGFDDKTVPPLCSESYSKLNLSQQEIAILKKNEKMACLDVANLTTKTKKEIVTIIENNYNEAMDLAFKIAKTDALIKPQEVTQLLKDIATLMGRGIVAGDWMREHDSNKFKVYTRVKDLESQLYDFSEQFLSKLNAIKMISDRHKREEAVIEMAAWCEYRVNLTDHFLADGCGKTSALLVNFIFMATDLPPTAMPVMNRKNYFDLTVVPTINLVIDEEDYSSIEIQELRKKQDMEWQRWLEHYKTSFFAKNNCPLVVNEGNKEKTTNQSSFFNNPNAINQEDNFSRKYSPV